ncbi:MAG: hypothetical protein E4H05_02445 [Acidimicrobiales bacterium]|nr:MAG: hypothetical protein E4H05_02445 [Acidimicrobiales bacterium]
MSPQVWWFVSRSSGMIAWGLLTLSVCWGLFISTKAVAKASSPAWLLDLHRYLGGTAVIFTAIHLIGLAADNYVTFGWAETFVPMASSWKTGPVAFGIVGFYLLLAIEITSLAMKQLPRKLWRWVHHRASCCTSWPRITRSRPAPTRRTSGSESLLSHRSTSWPS